MKKHISVKKIALPTTILLLGMIIAQSSLAQGLPGSTNNEPPAYTCYSDYQSWPSSNTYKNNVWATEGLWQGSDPVRYVDINGDGKLDLLLISHDSTHRRSCVNLNTGIGWELVHKCYAVKSSGTWTFYGDCAETE